MPAPELVGQSSVRLGERGNPESREWAHSLERRIDQCGASTENIPSNRDAFFRTHTAWAPKILLPGGIARTGCRQQIGSIRDVAVACTRVVRSDPDSYDGRILADCQGCSCEQIGLGSGGFFRGIPFACRFGQGVMLWTNDDVGDVLGDLFPEFDPEGNTWGMCEYDVFKPRGCVTQETCLDPYLQSRFAHLELHGCGCCFDFRDPLRSCGLRSEIPVCLPWVNNDCNETVPGANQGTFEEKRDFCDCIGDPGSFRCQTGPHSLNREYFAARFCQRGDYIGVIRFVGLLRGTHTQVDDTVVRQNWHRFWVNIDLEDSQSCSTGDWGRNSSVVAYDLTVSHRMDDRASKTALLPLEFNFEFQNWMVTRPSWITFSSRRNGFIDHPGGDITCANMLGVNVNGNEVSEPFAFGTPVDFSGVG